MPANETIELKAPKPTKAPARGVTELAVTGMTCGNCARHVMEAIQGVPGVESANVSLDRHQAAVRWRAGTEPNVEAVIKAVEHEGFGAKAVATEACDHGEHKLAGWQVNLWLGVPATLVLMLGEWVFGLAAVRWFQWLSLGLAGLVQIFAGARFYRGAWSQLKVGSSNMDTLVALGSTTAFVYSVWALFSRHAGHVYFMEAAAIITLISVGHWTESLVSVRASSALQKLLNLTPALARRRRPDGGESEVPVSELEVGEWIALRPGDRVPTDGIVEQGESAVDESMLTGESVPMDKKAGSQLYAGTVNLNGRLIVRVTAMGEATALAHIIAAVQRAQNSRANIQRLGDRVSSVFVPIVVTIALAAGLWWGLAPESANQVHNWLAHFAWAAQPPELPLAAGFIIASAVLIIACPCAMGLATPAAIMAGSNAAAQRGILVRDGVALEKAGQVTAVVFDKTGTLTVGKPSVVKVWESEIRNPKAAGGNRPDGRIRRLPVLEMAAALARHSSHPISQAIARLSSVELVLTGWQEMHGAGVQGRSPPSTVHSSKAEGQGPDLEIMVKLGSLRWLRDSGVDLAAGKAFVEEWSGRGATIVGLAQDRSLIGLFAVQDTVKTGVRAVVRRLQLEGLSTYLVTGDNQLTAATIAREAGIEPDHVFAEVRPQQKASFVKEMQQRGARVAFVGDGINDAPALEQADLGIAVSRASDIAREAADIILLKSEIEAVPESLGLARATLRTIKQNLFWAFFYNAVGIPLAALGFMSPILCAAAMGLSDLVVIGNALRLRRWTL
jgi:Cu+-exporting ATPase